MKRTFKKFICLSLALAIAVICPSSVFAQQSKESKVIYIWNGEISFKEGCDYSVRSSVHIKDSLTIPEGMTLYIRDKGTLTVDASASLKVEGTIKVNSGGLLRNWGDISVKTGGCINVYGWLVNREDSNLTCFGDVNIFTAGRLNNMGNFSGESGSNLYVAGHYYLRENAALNVRGKMRIQPQGFVRLYSEVKIYPGGVIKNSGMLDLAENGSLTLSGGNLEVKETGSITGAGTVYLDRFLALENAGDISAPVKQPPIRQVNGVFYVGEVLYCSKDYPLPSDYGDGEDANALEALQQMRDDSGYPLDIVSGYRSYESQGYTFSYWEALYGTETAERVSARAGTSEHQTGCAFDITSLYTDYADTDEGKWLAENCWKYGFIIRYPEDCEPHTGYTYEPWHIRYVGKDIAEKIHEESCCLEKFLGIS